MCFLKKLLEGFGSSCEMVHTEFTWYKFGLNIVITKQTVVIWIYQHAVWTTSEHLIGRTVLLVVYSDYGVTVVLPQHLATMGMDLARIQSAVECEVIVTWCLQITKPKTIETHTPISHTIGGYNTHVTGWWYLQDYVEHSIVLKPSGTLWGALCYTATVTSHASLSSFRDER